MRWVEFACTQAACATLLLAQRRCTPKRITLHAFKRNGN
jgi:hypothetical protein